VSHAGARGLMQMMPATARETARRTKTPFDLSQLTADPAYCARLGAAHLGDLMGEWRGAQLLVFAAYNAGSGNVRDWIKAYGDPRDPSVDALDWIERIPFSETRNYVQRVSENIVVYRQLLFDQIAFEQPSGLIPATRRE
jgi:soluble lytic murein transglycosylase